MFCCLSYCRAFDKNSSSLCCWSTKLNDWKVLNITTKVFPSYKIYKGEIFICVFINEHLCFSNYFLHFFSKNTLTNGSSKRLSVFSRMFSKLKSNDNAINAENQNLHNTNCKQLVFWPQNTFFKSINKNG